MFLKTNDVQGYKMLVACVCLLVAVSDPVLDLLLCKYWLLESRAFSKARFSEKDSAQVNQTLGPQEGLERLRVKHEKMEAN